MNQDEKSESLPDPPVGGKPEPVARAVYYTCPTGTFTLTFHWTNSADTCIRGSLLEEADVGPAGPIQFPFAGVGWYQVRIGPAVNADGSERTRAVIKLPKTWVRVLRADSSQPNRVNALLLFCSCSIEIAKPANGWRGGLRTETGVAVTFDEGFLLSPEQRTLQVPH